MDKMTGEFTRRDRRDLFGGAIVAEIPEVFVDASRFRPVPSTQEVFVSSSDATDISIVIDILQHVPLPDIDACKEHFEDVIDGREGSLGKLFQIEPTNEFTKIGPSTPTYIIHGTVSSPYHVAPPPTDLSYLDAQKSLPYVLLLMVVFRLEAHNTDLVVTVNCPITKQADSFIEKRVWHPAYDHPPNGTDKTGAPVVDYAVTLLKSVAGTLEVNDWGLFSPQD
ncbi:hypothetical protein BGX38DRAFT_1214361 [Terfezia claveryi]|nr:hypothetical protein BGX38DRAFT_1214361 [Terfezia claveryi]